MNSVKRISERAPATKVSATQQPNGIEAVLNRLLAMAQTYRSEGSPWQAMEMYWELVEDHPDTPQAEEARKVLLEIAMSYEHNGSRREARSIYERLI